MSWSAWFNNPFKAIKAVAEDGGKPHDYNKALAQLAASAQWETFSPEYFLDELLQEIAGATNIVCQWDATTKKYRAAYDD